MRTRCVARTDHGRGAGLITYHASTVARDEETPRRINSTADARFSLSTLLINFIYPPLYDPHTRLPLSP